MMPAGGVHWATYVIAVPMALLFVGMLGLFLLSDGRQAHDDRVLAWEFVDVDGAPRFGRQFQDARPFSDGLAPVRTTEGWGAIDTTGALVIPARFDVLGPCAESLCAALEDGQWGYVDPAGAWVIPPRFHAVQSFRDGVAPVAISLGLRRARSSSSAPVVEASYGLLSVDGSWLRPASEDQEAPDRLVGVRRGEDPGWSVAYHEGTSGFLDADGRPVLGRFEQARPFSEGRAAVQQDDRWGIIDADGAWIVPASFELRGQGYVEGRVAFRTAGGGAFVDREGGVVARGYDDVGPFGEGLAAVRQDGTWGFVDRAGEVRVPPRFHRVEHPFQGGAAIVRTDDDRDNVAFVFEDGRVLGGYADAGPYADGLAPVRVSRRSGS